MIDKYITYDQLGGRSGHVLKNIFTCYVVASLVDNLVVLPQKHWNHTRWFRSGEFRDGQLIINFDTTESQAKLNNKKFSKIITIEPSADQWDGMNFKQFSKLKQTIENAPVDSLIILKPVTRLHIHQPTEWYNKKLIKSDPLVDKIIPVLRNLYFKNNNDAPINCLSIHVRRGDVNNPQSDSYVHKDMRWPVEYFKQAIITFRKKFPDIPINIFSEKAFSDDLHVLKKFDNLNLILGDGSSLQKDMNHMINSRFFMPCNSGFSTWISYISRGKIIMPKNREIKTFHKEHIW